MALDLADSNQPFLIGRSLTGTRYGMWISLNPGKYLSEKAGKHAEMLVGMVKVYYTKIHFLQGQVSQIFA